MYKLVATFEVLPGKLSEMKELMKRLDEERSRDDPTYTPIKRYISVYGNVAQIVTVREMEELPKEPLVFAETPVESTMGESFAMEVPGRTFVHVLKELDLGNGTNDNFALSDHHWDAFAWVSEEGLGIG